MLLKTLLLLSFALLTLSGFTQGVIIYEPKKPVWEWRGCFTGLQTTKQMVDFPLSKMQNNVYLSAYYGKGRVNIHFQVDVPAEKNKDNEYPPLLKLGVEFKIF